ncbi:MAG: sulfatase [Phycisphaerae bacterium]|nr:sulfatase [Phycisphaerae bacterium]
MRTIGRPAGRGFRQRHYLYRMPVIAVVLFSTTVTLAAAAPSQAKRPNVIFFLVDDLGWMDSTVYGSRYYETPNVERLAARGMMFTDAYAANPLCSPTRASIMTGKYPARLGITVPGGHLPARPDLPIMPEKAPAHEKMLLPNSRRFLPLEEVTIAEALHDAGYRTGFIGKWHLGHDEKFWPLAQGFDVNVGGGRWPGPPSYHAPYKISTLPDGPKGEYITDRLTDEALSFLDAGKGRPFFLCFWHYAVHAPYQAKDALTARYKDRKDPRGKQNNPIMAAMIKSMDESLGRLLDKLDELKIADNTIIIFFSDNGGNEYDRVGPEEWLPTNNDPLRLGKGSIYEGGVRVPMMVYWPGVVAKGSRCAEVVSSVDFYPTILDMVGLKPRAGQIIDGRNIVPLLKGKAKLDRQAVFCHMPHRIKPVTGWLNAPSTSVRKGKWKLIRFYETNEAFPNPYELYDLEADVGETNNLAGTMPDKVKELDALIDGFLKDTNAAYPKPNPAYDPDAKAVVDGWRPSGQCVISAQDGALQIKSIGGDPFITTDQVPAVSGRLVIKLRAKSSGKGVSQFFWTTAKAPRFGPHQRLDFDMKHDGQWHECEIAFTAKDAIKAIRIDPGTAPGLIAIDWIRLHRQDGTVLKAWEFGS